MKDSVSIKRQITRGHLLSAQCYKKVKIHFQICNFQLKNRVCTFAYIAQQKTTKGHKTPQRKQKEEEKVRKNYLAAIDSEIKSHPRLLQSERKLDLTEWWIIISMEPGSVEATGIGPCYIIAISLSPRRFYVGSAVYSTESIHIHFFLELSRDTKIEMRVPRFLAHVSKSPLTFCCSFQLIRYWISLFLLTYNLNGWCLMSRQ